MSVVLTYDQRCFIAKTTFAARHIPKEAGFTFDSDLKRFVTWDMLVAVKLRKFADFKANYVLDSMFIKQTPVPNLTIKKGLKLDDYQISGTRHMLSYNKTYCALDPGLGKSALAITAMNSTARGPFLITSPDFLRFNWEAQITKWGTGLKVKLLESGKINRKHLNEAGDADVIVVADSMLDNLDLLGFLFIEVGKFKHIFIDEAHRFKNPEALRTIGLFGAYDSKRKGETHRGVINLGESSTLLSGTPMPKNPIEMWAPLIKHAPETIEFMSRHEYGVKYCNGFEDLNGWNYEGSSNASELKQRLQKTYMRRVRKADVWGDRPPQTHEIVLIGEDLPVELKEFEAKVLSKLSIDDILDRAELGDIARYRRLLGLSKVKACATHIAETLREQPQVSMLVFAHHVDVVKRLGECLKAFDPFIVTGETKNRFDVVQEFQRSPNRRLLIGNIEALGVGCDADKATIVRFVEFSTVPGVNKQASDRADRYTQTKQVHNQYYVYRESYDEIALRSVMRREKIIEATM